MKRFLCFMSTMLLILSITACNTQIEVTPTLIPTSEPTATSRVTETPESSMLEVHYIDVGQADAALAICGDDVMLIDGGNVADSDLIIAYLKKLNIQAIDYIICTHAHEDHVGGLSAPLSVMPVGAVYAPVTESDSKAYQIFKQKVHQQNSEIIHPTPAETIPLGNARVQFIAPITEDAGNLNNTSIVLKVTHGKTSFLFTGDAETDEENDIINAGYDLSADVLKVGHHGSDGSTGYVWLREIMPKYAIISVGKDNSYGHPTETVLSRLRDADVKLYRTDLQGDIVVVSDGENITFTTSRNENIQTNETVTEKADTNTVDTETSYIGNKNSKKFHRQDCSSLPAEKNRVELSSREEAMDRGFVPCKRCCP